MLTRQTNSFSPLFAPEGPAGGGAAPSGSGGSETTASAPSSTSGGAESSTSGASSTPETHVQTNTAPDSHTKGGNVDWFSSLSGDDDDSGVVEIPAEKSASDPAQIPPPEPPAQPKPQQEPSQPAKPDATEPAKPEGAKEEVKQQTAESPVPQPWQLDKLAELMETQGPALEAELAKTFALGPEDVEALEGNAAEAIPKLLARSAIRAQKNTLAVMARAIPQLIANEMTRYKAANENMDKFFAKWPQLDRVKHADVVMQMGKTYRQLNPGASTEQMIEDLGPYVMMKAGVAVNPTAQQAPKAPAAGGGPRSNGTSPSFVPAVNAGPAGIPSSQEAHPWADLYKED